MRVALVGDGRLIAGIINALLESDHEVVAIVLNGRKRPTISERIFRALEPMLAASLSPRALAKRHGIPVVFIDKMTPEELEPLAQTRPDLLIVAGFSIILKRPILDLPAVGCVNVHSSLLPKHRGPNPFAAVVIQGEQESGVSFHMMTEAIDDGDILAQFRFPISETDTGWTVYKRAMGISHDRALEVVDQIAQQGLAGTPQDPALATYDKRLEGDALFMDWTKPARVLQCFVRGCVPFFHARFRFRGQTVYLWDAEAVEGQFSEPPGTVVALSPVTVAAGDGALRIKQAFVKRPIPWAWPYPMFGPKIGQRLV